MTFSLIPFSPVMVESVPASAVQASGQRSARSEQAEGLETLRPEKEEEARTDGQHPSFLDSLLAALNPESPVIGTGAETAGQGEMIAAASTIGTTATTLSGDEIPRDGAGAPLLWSGLAGPMSIGTASQGMTAPAWLSTTTPAAASVTPVAPAGQSVASEELVVALQSLETGTSTQTLVLEDLPGDLNATATISGSAEVMSSESAEPQIAVEAIPSTAAEVTDTIQPVIAESMSDDVVVEARPVRLESVVQTSAASEVVDALSGMKPGEGEAALQSNELPAVEHAAELKSESPTDQLADVTPAVEQPVHEAAAVDQRRAEAVETIRSEVLPVGKVSSIEGRETETTQTSTDEVGAVTAGNTVPDVSNEFTETVTDPAIEPVAAAVAEEPVPNGDAVLAFEESLQRAQVSSQQRASASREPLSADESGDDSGATMAFTDSARPTTSTTSTTVEPVGDTTNTTGVGILEQTAERPGQDVLAEFSELAGQYGTRLGRKDDDESDVPPALPVNGTVTGVAGTAGTVMPAIDGSVAGTGQVQTARAEVLAPAAPPQISHQVQMALATAQADMRANGSRSFELLLDPPELGRLLIQMSRNDKGVSVRIASENESVQSLLESSGASIQDALQLTGFELGQFDSSSSGSGQSSPLEVIFGAGPAPGSVAASRVPAASGSSQSSSSAVNVVV